MSAAGIAQIAAVHGLLHGGRRVRARDERRDRHRARAGDDLPRRPAAREGGHGRGGHRRGARRRRPAQPPLGRHRPPRRRRRSRRCRSCARSSRRSRRARPRRGSARPPRSRRSIPAELYGAVPTDPRAAYDPREIIARIVDGSRLHEFKALYGDDARVRVRARPRPPGRDPRQQRRAVLRERAEGRALRRAVRPARGSRCCSCRTSRASWSAARPRPAASPATARRWSPPVSCARVPKLTVIVGGSYGAGNYGMCGRAYGPRFLWMWPNARISVMGGEQAATVLSAVASDRDPAEIEALRTRTRAKYETRGPPVPLDRAPVGRRRHRARRDPRRRRAGAVGVRQRAARPVSPAPCSGCES